jgi:2'-5' RNA ligase
VSGPLVEEAGRQTGSGVGRLLGVAIGLPDPFHGELQSWRERLGDPDASKIPPHVTLASPTPLEDVDVGAVVSHLRKVAEAESGFRITLRGSGTFRPISPVVFVMLAEGISDCERLANAIRTGPLDRPLQFPYHPHVTVAHDLPEAQLDRAFTELATYTASFMVDGFTMFQRGNDGAWRPCEQFVFGVPALG